MFTPGGRPFGQSDYGDRTTLLSSQKSEGLFLLFCTLHYNLAGFSEGGETDSNGFSVTTDGILRFPNSLQRKEAGNGFGEGWAKLSHRPGRPGPEELSLFTLGNFVAGNTDFAYNKSAKLGLGLAFSIQQIPELNLTFSARYDLFRERGTEKRQRGIRYAIGWYYHRLWEPQEHAPLRRLTSKGTQLKVYETVATPGSLDEGDTNIVATFGREPSRDYAPPSGDWLVTPFANRDTSRDKDRNDYNNKLVPSLGIKLRRLLNGDEIFLGARIGADIRWISGPWRPAPASSPAGTRLSEGRAQFYTKVESTLLFTSPPHLQSHSRKGKNMTLIGHGWMEAKMGILARTSHPRGIGGINRDLHEVGKIGMKDSERTSADFDFQDINRLFVQMEDMIIDRDTFKNAKDIRATSLSAVVNFGGADEELVAANDPGPVKGSFLRQLLKNKIRIAVP